MDATGVEGVGWSSAFAIPPRIERFVQDGQDLSMASNSAGVSADPRLGEGQGLVGVLSEGRMNRLMYTKQAVVMSMIPVEQRSMYPAQAVTP
eukprot:CAMPEP_0185204600 /NCGR_PEP_ID=MMETSP1140-20130426/55162_1 /TAXON_ID=298111 /ORGANISM="Pavlova sp., Strain CCMP459" /LENGTH=91 /DNA_ID=CAMNT_0027772155 /DNA_START=1 /DNA_END=276 /DNA_ORIENTATION=-